MENAEIGGMSWKTKRYLRKIIEVSEGEVCYLNAIFDI